MSKYNTIIKNDIVNGEGVCVSFFVQGCSHNCPGCFNPETWDFDGGQPYTDHTRWEIIEAIGANGIQRNFSVLGGEPLDIPNIRMVEEVIEAVRMAYPHIKIYLWTGYVMEEFSTIYPESFYHIVDMVDVIIDGPFIKEERDLSLKLRGSKNQRILEKINGEWREKDG